MATLAAAVALLALAALAGLAVRRHLPDVIAYLVVGAALGPTGAALLDKGQVHALRPLALGATALLFVVIGERLSLASFRAAPWVGVVAPVSWSVTAVVVFAAMRAAGASYLLASLVAILGGGGAPMTIAAIVRREGAQTTYARSLVALHASVDILVSLAFAVALPIAIVASGPGSSGVAAARGVAGALVGVLALATGAALATRGVTAPLRRVEPGLYLLVFTLGGAAIRLNAIAGFGAVALAYVGARTVSKLATGWLAPEGARVALGSLPHAGVSTVLAAAAGAAIPGRGIATITLSGVVLFELAGALIVRAQLRAGLRAAAPATVA